MWRTSGSCLVILAVLAAGCGSSSGKKHSGGPCGDGWRTEYSADADTIVLWHFDEGSGGVAADSSGFGNDGSVVGATWEPGKFGISLRFLDPDRVEAIPATFDDSIGLDMTVEAWIYWEGPHPHTPHGGSNVLCAADFEPPDWGGFVFTLTSAGGVQLSALYGSAGSQQVSSTETVPVGVWTHIAGVLDFTGGEMRVYINGRLVGAEVAVEPYWDMGDSSGYAAIGNNRYAAGDGQWAPFNGRIDEVRVSSTARCFG